MNVNLFMAAFWFVLGAVLIVIPLLRPNALNLTFGGGNISIGWLAILLGSYNVLRWSLLRAAARRRARAKASQPQEPRRHDGPPAEPNPDFDFGPSRDPKPGDS